MPNSGRLLAADPPPASVTDNTILRLFPASNNQPPHQIQLTSDGFSWESRPSPLPASKRADVESYDWVYQRIEFYSNSALLFVMQVCSPDPVGSSGSNNGTHYYEPLRLQFRGNNSVFIKCHLPCFIASRTPHVTFNCTFTIGSNHVPLFACVIGEVPVSHDGQTILSAAELKARLLDGIHLPIADQTVGPFLAWQGKSDTRKWSASEQPPPLTGAPPPLAKRDLVAKVLLVPLPSMPSPDTAAPPTTMPALGFAETTFLFPSPGPIRLAGLPLSGRNCFE